MSAAELPLDAGFADAYNKLKHKRTINTIVLKVDQGEIKIVRADKMESLPKVVEVLDDTHCCFIVYSLQGESEDGLIRMERIFTITYTPVMAKLDEKLIYEMQKGKQISKCTRGAIEIHVSTKDDLRRKINGVSFGASKAKKDERESDDDDDGGKNWMDD